MEKLSVPSRSQLLVGDQGCEVSSDAKDHGSSVSP